MNCKLSLKSLGLERFLKCGFKIKDGSNSHQGEIDQNYSNSVKYYLNCFLFFYFYYKT